MIRQCLILIGFLAIGELIVYFTHISLPSSIIGMLLLTLSLEMKWIKLEWIGDMANFLVANLGFFFVPSGVAIMKYFGLIKQSFIPISVATFLSTLLVLLVTGWIHQYFHKYGISRK